MNQNSEATENADAYVEAIDEDLDYQVMSGVTKMVQGKTVVYVANLSQLPVILKRGCRLGKVFLQEEMELCKYVNSGMIRNCCRKQICRSKVKQRKETKDLWASVRLGHCGLLNENRLMNLP